jgi:hypothetical protein
MQEDQDEIRSIGKTQILVTRQNVSAKGKERGNYFFFLSDYSLDQKSRTLLFV